MKKCDFCRYSDDKIKCTITYKLHKEDYCSSAIDKMCKVMCESKQGIDLLNDKNKEMNKKK